MLTLHIKQGEAVIVTGPDGKELRIIATKCSSGRVGLAFAAPREYRILRESLLQRPKEPTHASKP